MRRLPRKERIHQSYHAVSGCHRLALKTLIVKKDPRCDRICHTPLIFSIQDRNMNLTREVSEQTRSKFLWDP